MMKRLPDFFIIGASRSGTNSLRETLNQAKLIAPAKKKEIHFFDVDYNYQKGLRYYKKFFASEKEKISFDTTPGYLYSFAAPIRIKRDLPESSHKFIVLLRNPVDRAWSNYWHWQHKISKSELFNPDSELLKRGRYIEYLKHWVSLFGRISFFIIKAETFFEMPEDVVNFILNHFLNIPERVEKILYYDPKKKNPIKKESYPKPDKEVIDFLTEYYRRPNAELYNHFGIDWE